MKRSTLFICLGALISFSLGVARFELSKADYHPLDKDIEKKVSLTGIICAEPESKELTQKFCFEPKGSADRITISLARFPKYEYGDELSVFGKLELPENFEAYPGGPEFDYVSYLGKDDIRYIMSRPSIRRIAQGKGNRLVAFLINMKSAFMERIEWLLPEPHSSLVGGLLLGEKGTLPQDVSDNFKRSGLTHILVLSGSNVTVVAESLLRAFSFLPRAIGQSLGAFSIVLFALMTGASATTVRATFMALVLLFARGVGRKYDVVRALILAGIAMLLQNPRILAFDISFQLSFLATLAIIYVSPLVKDRLGFVTERFAIRETLSMTISSQIFTLPFILYKMGEISVIALVPNLLVLPAVSYAMLGGFVSGMLGFISPVIAFPVAWVTEIILSYMLKVVGFFGPLSFATKKATLGAPLLFLSYAVYAVIIWRLSRNRNSLPPSASSD
jgi:competence protein ComEC